MGSLNIVSRNTKIFRDRREAGRLLAYELGDYRNKDVVVMGIPRGGIIVAAELAQGLNATLDIVISRKLRTPGQEELAMGSISENGKVFFNDNVIRGLDIDPAVIEAEKQTQTAEINRRSAIIRKILPGLPISGKITIVTDDGVATGATTQAALWAIRQGNPAKLIAAIPVASERTIERIAEYADYTLCLRVPSFFSAVGQFYKNFNQIEDEELMQILEGERKRRLSINS